MLTAATKAVLTLNAMAADFKVGVIPNSYVRDLLKTIFNEMEFDTNQVDELVREAMISWGEFPEEA
jgi:hypothetical protein